MRNRSTSKAEEQEHQGRGTGAPWAEEEPPRLREATTSKKGGAPRAEEE
jgi:hypothetical protein